MGRDVCHQRIYFPEWPREAGLWTQLNQTDQLESRFLRYALKNVGALDQSLETWIEYATIHSVCFSTVWNSKSKVREVDEMTQGDIVWIYVDVRKVWLS